MAAATTRRPPGHPCDDTCGRATGNPAACRCACRGKNHGSFIATPEQLLVIRSKASSRDPFADFDQAGDEPW